MADETPGLSRSVEDYLKVIYSLCEPGVVASTSSIADTLEVQPASVTGMVKRLAEAGYLEHVPYRGVQLTDAGTRAALRVLRRHRILETYLTQRLGFPWEDVHQEAERLEHAASDELIERMAAALKNPSYDPHGAPIPTSSGEIEATDSYTLADLAPGEEARIRAVRDSDSAGLLAVEAAGLLPGTLIRVRGRTRNPPTLRVEVEGGPERVLEVELSVAQRVYVITHLPSETPQEGG
jgi:DtxR family Mn-dependent transcriptional regulator